MKRLFIFSKIFGVFAITYMIAACQSTSTTSTTAQKETLLAQAGFKSKSVTNAKQQQRLAQLPPNVVSAVKYNGVLYYVYPTATKNQILCGKQAQYNAYKQALKAHVLAKHAAQTGQQSSLAAQDAQEQNQIMNGDPEWSGETAGPRHILVQQYDGFGPLDPMQGD